MVIFISSAVRSPMSRLYLRLMCWMNASSILSPATRTERGNTILPNEMTATSVVPPPMSTIMLPGANRRRHRLLDQIDFARPGRFRRFAHGALLDRSNSEGHADDDARPRPH